jgi:autotransporter-associated beta strand protein
MFIQHITVKVFIRAACAAVFVAGNAHAGIYYWDNTSPIETSGFGTAGGTWGSEAKWSASATGDVTPGIVGPTTSDALNFGTDTATYGLAAGTVSVSGTVNAGTLTFGSQSGAITLSGGTALNFAAASVITVNNTSDTISSPITGAATSLTKTGTGTLTLSQGPGASGDLTVTAGKLTINGGDWTVNKTLHISNGTLEVNPTGKLQAGKSITFDAPGGGILKLGSNSNFYPENWGSQQSIVSAGGAQNQITGGLYGGFNPNGNTLNFNVARGTDPVSDLKLISSLWNGGSLTKTGGGILELTAGNSLNGTTTISAGTLLIAGAATLGSGAVTDNAALVFKLTSNLSVANAISGSGTLTQAGTNTTIRLTAANSYGATIITGGTLQIGNNTTTGTLGNGPVTNTAALTFKRSNDMAVGNTLSGTGTVTQAGAGTVTLSQGPSTSGDLTVTAGKLAISGGGGWNINNNLHISNGTLEINGWGGMAIQAGKTITFDAPGGGVLYLASGVNFYPANWGSQQLISSTGGAQNQIAGNINSNGNTLDFNITRGTDPLSDLKVTGNIIIGGSVKKTGDGILTLSGANSYSGATKVEGGTLVVAGSISSTAGTTVTNGALFVNGSLAGTVSVASGATLGGTNTIGAVTLASGAILEPGVATNLIGTLTLSGTAPALSGRNLVADVSMTSGICDKLVLSGTVDLTGLTVTVKIPGTLPSANTYVLISSTGALSGMPTLLGDLTYPWHLSVRNNTLVLSGVLGTMISIF